MKLLAEHPDVRFVFKEFPILGPESSLAAKAGLAAAKQGAYLKFHQALRALSGSITMNAIEELAGKQGLDASKLKRDMESPEVQSILARNRELGASMGVTVTPTFVVGGADLEGDRQRYSRETLGAGETRRRSRTEMNSRSR